MKHYFFQKQGNTLFFNDKINRENTKGKKQNSKLKTIKQNL